MRRDVEIVWVEDRQSEITHTRRVKMVKELIEDKGYNSEISFYSNVKDANKHIEDLTKRVDFFISDFNLTNDGNGIDYLMQVRRNKKYKQFFILYSNNSYATIKDEFVAKLEDNKLDLFSNFTFISLESSTIHLIQKEFQKAIDICLSKWDELNAFRGLCLCENAEFEYKLREKYNEWGDNKSYKELFQRLKREQADGYKSRYRNIFLEWEKLIDKRNLLAHTNENCDNNGFFLQSVKNEELIVREENLDEERKKILNLKKQILFTIENPNRPLDV